MMFTLGGVRASPAIVQEFWRGVRARRAVAREPVPVAFVSLVRRNRRRYGGYIVHIGIIMLFVGVAASSSFKNVQDVALQPGQSASVGDYKFTYVKPIAELHAAPNGRLERIALGAQLRVRKNGGKPQAAAHVEGLLPVAGLDARARSRASSTASRRPRSALDAEPAQRHLGRGRAGHRQDPPAHRRGRPAVRQGRRRPDRRAVERVPRAGAEGADRQLRDSPPPARFRFEVNPMVTWIWIGGADRRCSAASSPAGRPSAA